MSEQLRRLIPQARTLITKESFRDQSFGSLDGYIEDLQRPIDTAPLVRVVHTAMRIFPARDEESDGWLAPRVHASLRLFRSEAADQGIWDYLSVVVLRDYVIWRMADKDGAVNDLNQIIGPFRHQAVARLWWAAELSRNGADYRPTEQAFSSQDAVNYLTNVDAFHNRPAALAYIRFIGHKSGEKPIKQRAIETGKTLNHVLTTIVLDSFAPDSGGDMNAEEQWIAEAPDAALMDSVLPIGPNEPQVPEEKIYAVEQLLERLMEERRWTEVVDWSEHWIAEAQSLGLEATLPISASPGESGSINTVEKDLVANDDAVKDVAAKEDEAKDVAAKAAVSYERFVEALHEDLGVEPSEQTRDLFEKLSSESDETRHPETLEVLSKDEKITDAISVPGMNVSPDAVAASGDATRPLATPALADPVGSGEAQTTIDETAAREVEGLSKDKEIVVAMPPPGLAVSPDAVSSRADETQSLGEPSLAAPAGSGDAHVALVASAERVFEKLSPEQQTLARRVFLELTELGEGTLDTPRRVNIEELILRPEDQLPILELLKILSDARLIKSNETGAQIADAALIREWMRLRKWLDEDRAGLRLHRQLAQAAQEWEMRQRDPSSLYRGAQLAQALEWAKTHADEITAREREFLDASKKIAESAEQNSAQAATRRAEEEHRAAMQWRRRVLYLAAAMIIVPIVVAVVIYLAR